MPLGRHALLVHGDEQPLSSLKPFLRAHGIATSRARTCAEAASILTSVNQPLLIFTETRLADGAWADIKRLAEKRNPQVPVIVVSPQVDIPLYLKVLESGAYDFIVPPFREAEIGYVVLGARVCAAADGDNAAAKSTRRAEALAVGASAQEYFQKAHPPIGYIEFESRPVSH